MSHAHEDGSNEEHGCSNCRQNAAQEQAEAERLRRLTEQRQAGSVFWFNKCAVEVIDRFTGKTVATGPGFEPFIRTLIRRGNQRDEVTVVGLPWNPDTGEITLLVDVRKSGGQSERWYLSRVGLALRYTSGPLTGEIWDYVESYWTPYDADTGRELIPGRDIVHDRNRGNRPATVLAMSSLGHFHVRYEGDEQLTHYVNRIQLDPADYGVTTKQWTVDIELGRTH
ncbi:hypothetical protein [Streptomyces sp. NRRL F-5053]|uniref:hypothetical protein n=1 Tax=Streptomyces sp. NRRL F-5053 TaxID=1463854 RepID=UPI0004CC1C8A|nr:hypothetical protein [Streptomyces sp. NRRL F-5053]